MLRLPLLLLAFAMSGVALAQDAPPQSHRFIPEWAQTPTSYDCWGNYPRSARGNSVTGVVQMCCTPLENRRLDCRVAFETPEDRHFGETTLRVARRFRLTPQSYAAYRADPNVWLQLPVLWEPILPAENREEFLAAVNHRTRGLCAPPADLAARMPDQATATEMQVARAQVFRCPTVLDRRND